VLVSSDGASPPFPVVLDSFSPALRPGLRSYCEARPSWSDGDGLYLDAVGLGATIPATPTLNEGGAGFGGPFTAETPHVSIGGIEAHVLWSALVLASHGEYRVRITPSQNTPEGLEPMVLTIGAIPSNTVYVVVGTTNALATGGTLSDAAPESLVTATGCSRHLADATLAGNPRSPTLNLLGTTIRIKDSSGTERSAAVEYVDPLQVNYIVPAGTAVGPATVTITSGSGVVTSSPLEVRKVVPGIFSQPATAEGEWYYRSAPAGLVVRVRSGVQTSEPIQVDQSGRIVPIDMGPDTDEVYLALFGTGFRSRSSLADLELKIGGQDTVVEYAGPQGEIAGLDQVNVRLPRSLAGSPSANFDSDALDVQFTVAGRLANLTYLRFR
jgi:uncharacterized protein (TIGR03437 family)